MVPKECLKGNFDFNISVGGGGWTEGVPYTFSGRLGLIVLLRKTDFKNSPREADGLAAFTASKKVLVLRVIFSSSQLILPTA